MFSQGQAYPSIRYGLIIRKIISVEILGRTMGVPLFFLSKFWDHGRGDNPEILGPWGGGIKNFRSAKPTETIGKKFFGRLRRPKLRKKVPARRETFKKHVFEVPESDI